MTNLVSRSARVAYNALMDLRFGRPLAGDIPTRYAHVGAKDTANSDYLALARIFDGLVEPDDVLVDVGCGKGRVINWWIRHYDNLIVGVEIDPDVAAATRRRLRRFSTVTVITGNAVERLPRHGTLFYLYNPFESEVVHQFAAELESLGRTRGGPIRLIYNNCKHLEPFGDRSVWEVTVLDETPPRPFDRVAVIDYLPL